MLARIVSGGQTGVDRGALDAARTLGIAYSGWCPLGRRAEDGKIPPWYSLKETASEDYRDRTQRNVLDSDATLILVRGQLAGGTALTVRLAREARKPHLIVDLRASPDIERIRAWVADHRIAVLNVAGPRESQSPGIQKMAYRWLTKVLAVLCSGDTHGMYP
jgi:hypothetical protein